MIVKELLKLSPLVDCLLMEHPDLISHIPNKPIISVYNDFDRNYYFKRFTVCLDKDLFGKSPYQLDQLGAQEFDRLDLWIPPNREEVKNDPLYCHQIEIGYGSIDIPLEYCVYQRKKWFIYSEKMKDESFIESIDSEIKEIFCIDQDKIDIYEANLEFIRDQQLKYV